MLWCAARIGLTVRFQNNVKWAVVIDIEGWTGTYTAYMLYAKRGSDVYMHDSDKLLKMVPKALPGFEPGISCLLDRRFNR